MAWSLVLRAIASRRELRSVLPRNESDIDLDMWTPPRASLVDLAIPASIALLLVATSSWGQQRLLSPGDPVGLVLLTSLLGSSAVAARSCWRMTFRDPLCAELLQIARAVCHDCAPVTAELGTDRGQRVPLSEVLSRLQDLRMEPGRYKLEGLRSVVLGDTVIGYLFVVSLALCNALAASSYIFSNALPAAMWLAGIVAVSLGIPIRALWIRERVHRAVHAVIVAKCAHCGYPVPCGGVLAVTCPECGRSQPSASSTTASALSQALGIDQCQSDATKAIGETASAPAQPDE